MCALRPSDTLEEKATRGKITKAAVDALAPGDILADTEVKGFVARRLPSGVVTYGLRYRVPSNKQRWLALGLHGRITPEMARKIAKQRMGDVASERDPAKEREQDRQKAKDEATSTVNDLLDAFLARYAQKHLRRVDEVQRIFRVYVRPRIGSKSIYELRRRNIVEMLDIIEDDNGPVMADRTLAHVRKAFTWHASRDDEFNSPIVRGMARTKPKDRARKRVLDDQEIRDLWKALDTADALPCCYPALVRTLLLTAQRRGEVSGMTWDEVNGNVWTIPAERGEQQGHKTAGATGDKTVPLAQEVLALLGKPQKRGYVFSTTEGREAFSGFSKAKVVLDKRIAELRAADERPPASRWTHHDLRRTARSLMSRAGVSSNVAERVLGHVIPGVRGVYDRHEYLAEKRDALERLAQAVEAILTARQNAT